MRTVLDQRHGTATQFVTDGVVILRPAFDQRRKQQWQM